ncbi:MAG: hypothetical protein GC199_09085 [Alphaproteobacteria bacterium]|nr:hypothetical protein [Alphaproteobacteria bacterium]
MSPELLRNAWVELTPRRLFMMAGFLALWFAAASLGDEMGIDGVAASAEWLFYVIVVIWGTRSAARSVVQEIQDRTWDQQRLSALTAGEMVLGKLFGATLFQWFGGAICLAAILVTTLNHRGAAAAGFDILYFVSMALMAQGVALLASLLGVRRRTTHTRLDVFGYQAAGLFAALWVYWIWQTAAPGGATLWGSVLEIDTVTWWGMTFNATSFYLATLVIFLTWVLVGCVQVMRLELQMENGPFAWLGFLAFMAIYMAGLADINDWSRDFGTVVNARLAAATMTLGVLTYVMVLIEPKDRVHFRWLAGAFAAGQFGALAMRLPGWIYAYLGALILGLLLLVRIEIPTIEGFAGTGDAHMMILASLGFLTRDCLIFLAYHMRAHQRRGDFAAIVTLIAIYLIAPWFFAGAGLEGLLYLFLPMPAEPAIAGPIAAWAEAGLVAMIALGRLRSGFETAKPA